MEMFVNSNLVALIVEDKDVQVESILSLDVVCTPDEIQLGCSTSLSNLKAFAETFMEDRFEAAGLGPFAQEEAVPKTGAED